jgi:hypothetical protein
MVERPVPISLRIRNAEVIDRARKVLRRFDEKDLRDVALNGRRLKP